MYQEDVLVVDDDIVTCELVGEVLRAENCSPRLCTQPTEALRALRSQAFSLAFIDINMPEMGGIELASRIKDLSPLCEVILMTGFASIDNAIQAIKIGVTDYLRKPFGKGEIVLCIQRFRERKALRERISMAEERYYRLVQNVPMLIFRLRRDSRLDFINQACYPLLGYTPQEAMYSLDWLLERIHPEDRDRVRDLLQSGFEPAQSSLTTECRLVHRDERLVYGLMKCITNTGGNSESDDQFLEGIIVDITDRILLEKTLVQREKLNTLGAIAAEVAHEIRNPLVSIGGFARRLQKRLPEATEADIILRESERLERLLGRIRNYLAPVEIRYSPCSINAIVSNSIELLSPEIQRHKATCRLDFDPELPRIMADPDILLEVGINLIRNALAAMPMGGELIIKTFETDQNLRIDFKNELGGPKLKKPENLFLPLDEGGESIGLPLSYRLLKNMGGLLSFDQTDTHVVFTVSLAKRPRLVSESVMHREVLELAE